MIDTPSDGKGTYLYRSVDGTGTVSFQSVQLRWNYGVDGLTADEPDVEVQVIGIEMVYVPQGVFAAGSGGTETQAFTLTTINMADATVSPFRHGIAGRRGGGLPDRTNRTSQCELAQRLRGLLHPEVRDQPGAVRGVSQHAYLRPAGHTDGGRSK